MSKTLFYGGNKVWRLFKNWPFYDLGEMNTGKSKMYEAMWLFLGVENYGSTEKADVGNIKRLLSDDGNRRIRDAINNAKMLEGYWSNLGKRMPDNVMEMNPSVSVHILVERLLDEIEYSCK